MEGEPDAGDRAGRWRPDLDAPSGIEAKAAARRLGPAAQLRHHALTGRFGEAAEGIPATAVRRLADRLDPPVIDPPVIDSAACDGPEAAARMEATLAGAGDGPSLIAPPSLPPHRPRGRSGAGGACSGSRAGRPPAASRRRGTGDRAAAPTRGSGRPAGGRPRRAARRPATPGARCRGSWRRSTSAARNAAHRPGWRRSSGSAGREPGASGCRGSGTGCRSGASCPGRVDGGPDRGGPIEGARSRGPDRGGWTRRARLAGRPRGLRARGAARAPARPEEIGVLGAERRRDPDDDLPRDFGAVATPDP